MSGGPGPRSAVAGYSPLLLDVDPKGVATLTLNRPRTHNAFDEDLIARLHDAFVALDTDAGVHVVVLAAAGKSFCAGADLNWMRRASGYDADDNLRDARALADMLKAWHRLSKPTLARVQGSAYGGGVGLVAASDFAIAREGCTFRLSEVRLGLIPAVIAPYVVEAIGVRQARRYMLSAEAFDACEAERMGLVHRVVPADRLEAEVDALLDQLAGSGPGAVAAAKDLITAVARRPLDDVLIEDTARRITAVRGSDEAREGVAAFLEKRKPAWVKT